MTKLLSFMLYASLCTFVNWIYEPHDPFDKGTFDILSWPQLPSTAELTAVNLMGLLISPSTQVLSDRT